MYTPFESFVKSSDVAPFLDDDTKLIYPLCDNTLFVISKCIDLDPDKNVVFNSNQATVAGLFNKQVKLFQEFYEACKRDKMYLCVVLQRVIYEAFLKMEYLIKYGNEAQTAYRLYSYKDRNKFYEQYKSSEKGYFKIRIAKYLSDIANDGFTLDEIKVAKRSFGGKKMDQLVKEFENESLYGSLYGMASDSIHSDWGDIRPLYLQKTPEQNSYVIADENLNKVHFRYLLPMLDIIIDSAIKYIDWILSIDSSYQKLIVYKNMLNDFKRVYTLIMECVFKEYNNDDSKYMYE